jgi:hypothetical protein
MEDDELRLENIKECSRKKLDEYLLQLENDEINEDEILAITFASICTAALVGYSVEGLKQMVEDSTNYANHLMKLLDETMKDEE